MLQVGWIFILQLPVFDMGHFFRDPTRAEVENIFVDPTRDQGYFLINPSEFFRKLSVFFGHSIEDLSVFKVTKSLSHINLLSV